MKSSTRNDCQDEFVTITNCSINNIFFEQGAIPKRDHATIHLTSITKGDKTIRTEIIANLWGKTAVKTCTYLREKKGIYNIYGKVLSRKILLEQETRQIELIGVYVTKFGIQKIENTTMKQDMNPLKSYRLYWLPKKPEIIKGNNIKDAFRRAGYPCNTTNKLNRYKEIDNPGNTGPGRCGSRPDS